jgi:hypothetical protein
MRARSRYTGFLSRQMGSKAPPVALWRHLLSLPTSRAGNEWASQPLGRATALAQTGFCCWQERIGRRGTDRSWSTAFFGAKASGSVPPGGALNGLWEFNPSTNQRRTRVRLRAPECDPGVGLTPRQPECRDRAISCLCGARANCSDVLEQDNSPCPGSRLSSPISHPPETR